MDSLQPVIWVGEALQGTLIRRLDPSKPARFARSPEDIAKARAGAIVFVDAAALESLERAKVEPNAPVIALLDSDDRRVVAKWLQQYPWLCHVVGVPLLELDATATHLANVIKTAQNAKPRLLDWIEAGVRGRRVGLTNSTARRERLERMTEFLQNAGVGDRTIEHLRDVAEELITNAFYDAPVAAGVVRGPISRTDDVILPEDRACDIAYGSSDGLAMVRVRDPFGSLSRRRIVEVLARCASAGMDVEVDESMGGAGLGLWRIITASSFVAISVVNGRHTEFLVGLATKRSTGARPFALHMFFRETPQRRFWRFTEDESSPQLNKSVTILASDARN